MGKTDLEHTRQKITAKQRNAYSLGPIVKSAESVWKKVFYISNYTRIDETGSEENGFSLRQS